MKWPRNRWGYVWAAVIFMVGVVIGVIGMIGMHKIGGK